MLNTVILVAVGGAIGAILREFLMLTVGTVWDGFPLDILTANVVALFLLGLAFALHGRKILTDGVYVLVGTGLMGGLSTFCRAVARLKGSRASSRKSPRMADPLAKLMNSRPAQAE